MSPDELACASPGMTSLFAHSGELDVAVVPHVGDEMRRNVLPVRGRVTFQQRPDVDVLVPLGHPDREVTESVRGDVDAARQQANRAAVLRTPGSRR